MPDNMNPVTNAAYSILRIMELPLLNGNENLAREQGGMSVSVLGLIHTLTVNTANRNLGRSFRLDLDRII